MNPTPLALFAAVDPGMIFDALPASRPTLLGGTATSWLEGLAHPVINIGHLLGLLALGIAAPQLGGRSRWGLPALFAVLLGFGVVLGTEGALAPMLDTIILTTTLGLTLLVLGKVRLSLALTASLIGAFGLFHGLVDGMDMIEIKADLPYLAGYLGGSIGLVLLGLGIGEGIHHYQTTWANYVRRLSDRLRGPAAHA